MYIQATTLITLKAFYKIMHKQIFNKHLCKLKAHLIRNCLAIQICWTTATSGPQDPCTSTYWITVVVISRHQMNCTSSGKTIPWEYYWKSEIQRLLHCGCKAGMHCSCLRSYSKNSSKINLQDHAKIFACMYVCRNANFANFYTLRAFIGYSE